MNWSEVRANWTPLREQVERRWSKLSALEITAIGGRRHELISILRMRYGIDQESAASEVDDFVRGLQVLSL